MYMILKNAVDRQKQRHQARSAYTHLMKMDDAILRDIGVNRGDLYARVHGLDRD